MKTAKQHNVPLTGQVILPPPITPKVIVTESDPGEETAKSGSPLDASAEIGKKTQIRLQFKGTRETILAEAENSRSLPRAYKTLLAGELAAIADAGGSLWRVDIFRHPHGHGANLGITIAVLK